MARFIFFSVIFLFKLRGLLLPESNGFNQSLIINASEDIWY